MQLLLVLTPIEVTPGSEETKVAGDKNFQLMVGEDKYNTSKQARQQEIEEEKGDEYDSDSDQEIDENTKEVIKIVNVHKTYLLGIEGVPALRGVGLTI